MNLHIIPTHKPRTLHRRGATHILALILILLGGMANEAWATVTYHILTKEFTTKDYYGADFRTNIRVEALRCTSNDATVGLPEEFKSPLATNYTYYTTATITYQTIYDTTGDGGKVKGINTQYDCYTNLGGDVSAGADVGSATDIYVTYDYDATAAASLDIDLAGTKEYNIQIGSRILCFNKSRANRPGAIKAENVSAANLISKDFSYVTNCDFSSSYHYFHFRFKLTGSDPYNITIESAYDLETTFDEKNNDNTSVTVKKEFRGSTIFAKLGANMWLASDAHKRWYGTSSAEATAMEGFFRGNNNEMNPIFNAFALLNHTSGSNYTLVGSKLNVNNTVNQPSNNQYQYLTGNGNNPNLARKAAQNAEQVQFWPIETYTFKVRTPLTASDVTATGELSSYTRVNEPTKQIMTSEVPSSLRRKYCSFTYFYKEAAKTNQITTYAQAYDNSKVIYVGYTVSGLPFQTLAADGSYTAAKWYSLTSEGSSNIVQWNSTNHSTATTAGTSAATTLESHYAFIGDPYELAVINRSVCKTNSGLRYVGTTTGSAEATALTNYDSTVTPANAPVGYRWEIPYDATAGSFTLRERKDGATMYWGWSSNVIVYSATATRLTVNALPQYTYKYNIVRADKTIAVMASTTQDVGSQLSLATLPSIIVSPFLVGETLTFYSDAACTTSITEASDVDESNIYVRYTTSALSTKPFTLNESQQFNVKLNGEYIYWDAGTIKSNTSPTSDDLTSNAYLWRLRGRDPYAMRVDNVGATISQHGSATEAENVTIYADDGTSTTESRYKGMWVKKADTNWANDQALEFDPDRADASLFIAKSSGYAGIYEVMAATGSDIDASSTYYHIGRSATNVVKIYSNATYHHGDDEVDFILEQTRVITYHLIDKAGNDLLQVESKSPDLAMPAAYVSPLVEKYHYFTDENCTSEVNAMPSGSANIPIYVKYDVNDLISFNVGSKMYRLRFANGENSWQEDGHDGVTTTKKKAYYPYCNGDCNFFVYDDTQLTEQLGGAASTRTRWPWYVESLTSDPYHVKIVSRQQQGNDGVNHRMYFRTYKPDGYDYIVTGLTMPGISENAASEYMVLGEVGAYKLVTTETVTGKLPGDAENSTTRRTVTSFEQYWKTYDTIKRKIFKAGAAVLSDPFTVPDIEYTSYNTEHGTNYTYRTYLTDVMGWHCYEEWAYAKRWNGYNAAEVTNKGFEDIEHWYQTVDMGDGAFDFEEMEITPVLVLLDQHGWEIMRKPLPTGTNDPDKEAKYDAIRPYNSPMVEKYYFFNNATKVPGYHRYTLRVNTSGYRDFIKWNGAPYYSTDLTSLPPFTASGVTDSFGDVQDQYVVYTVKDEYAQNLNQEFLVVQGGQVAKTEDGSSITGETPSGGLSSWITAGSIDNKYKWKVTLNDSIDAEMGKLLSDKFEYASNGLVPNWPAADGKGFDPYNIQIESVANTGMLFTTNATSATLSEGSWTGNGSSVSLATAPSPRATSLTASGHDNKTVNINNQTFMAVADANGNMQLMPRFDHSHRVQAFTALADPQTNSAGDQTGTQTTFMLRPLVYEYIIVDNQGRESLRYKAGGEFYPGIPAHFKSPLAKEFEYYKNLTSTDGVYQEIPNNTDITAKQITGSFAAAGLSSSTNTVYVRYKYDDVYDDDHDKLLQGPWLTVSLGGESQWIYYNGTLNNDGSGIFTAAKPDPLTNAYQWKFLRSPYVDDGSAYLAPDPYAVTISNREANAGENKNVALKVGTIERYALLSHPDGGYAMAAAGTGNTSGYTFLNGNGMTAHGAGTPQAAAIVAEDSFSPASSTISDDAQLQVTNDVTHNYTYHIITSTGVQAVSATQTNEEAVSNSFVPTVPYDAQSPLLNIGDYNYYGIATESSGTYTIDINTHITSLYGIYNDEVFVKYNYNASTSPFRVPNVKGTTGEPSHVTKGAGSNDSPLDISGELGYNIIWYNDNMMYNNSGSVGNAGSLSLTGTTTHVWQFAGSDPYALQIKNKGADKYLNGKTTLADDASTTFMLLRKTDYDYGILQATGTSNRLTNYGEQTTTGDPTKYVIFALATYKLYYNLLVGAQNTDLKTIPVRTMASGEQTNTTIKGTSMRTSAPAAYDAGTVSLGDALATPYTLSRPFCTYTYYIDVVQNSDASANTELTNKYQGLLCTNLPDDADLIGKIMYVDVAYQFDDYTQDDYEANPAFRFETDNTNSSTTKWYTAESRSTIPFLVNYKYGTTTVGASAGREQHCTNDHLWCPVGDPYGFYMHNRYATKNHNGWSEVMTTSNPPAANAQMMMSATTDYAVYEMIPTSTNGYFRLHPLSGAAGLYVWGTLEAGVPVGKLSLTNSTDWIFNLTTTQLEPYYARKGYVGGLNSTGVAAYEAANGDLRTIQGVVYNDVNIQSYASGYYRLHSIPSTSISPVRYMSGYTHKTELTPGSGTDVSPVAIPLHFYEQAGTSSTFYGLGGGFTETAATRGELPISAVEYDPASIFYFDANNRMKTQGLEVKEYKMTDTANDGTQFTVEDIGAAVVTLRNGTLATGNYLNYNQSTDIYDLKYTTGEMLDYTKWCLQPVQKETTASAGEKALLLTLNNGGDGYYYATFCAPFDVMLPSTATAYVCTAWDTEIIHPVSIDQTIPAGTPAIIRSTAAGPLTLTLPGTASSAETCVFSGKYLEQLLSDEITADDKVYTFGLSITGLSLTTDAGADNGRVHGTDVTKATTGVGFYLNANPNKEANPSQALWTKNNRYVYANKIYYRTGGSGASSRQQTRGVEFVPVVFDLDEDGQPGEDESVGGGFPVGICVYNLQGRCVATEQQVKDGSWRSQVPAGIYIMRPARGMSKGKKIVIK